MVTGLPTGTGSVATRTAAARRGATIPCPTRWRRRSASTSCSRAAPTSAMTRSGRGTKAASRRVWITTSRRALRGTGWGAGPTWGYSRAAPRTPNGDGMLRVYADLWSWLRAHHPEMRTIANEAFGTPSQMFADGILIEGGFATGKTELDYEAAKALGTTVISYDYPSQYARPGWRASRPRPRGTCSCATEPSASTLPPGGTWSTRRRRSWARKARPSRAATLADGEWHVATLDMRKLPNIAEVRGLALGMEAGSDEAHL